MRVWRSARATGLMKRLGSSRRSLSRPPFPLRQAFRLFVPPALWVVDGVEVIVTASTHTIHLYPKIIQLLLRISCSLCALLAEAYHSCIFISLAADCATKTCRSP